jgi:hypothetical protein
MFSKPLTVAASSMFALSYAFPLFSFSNSAIPNTLAVRDTYTTFGGDGSMAAGWPHQNEWLPFDKAWYAYL